MERTASTERPLDDVSDGQIAEILSAVRGTLDIITAVYLDVLINPAHVILISTRADGDPEFALRPTAALCRPRGYHTWRVEVTRTVRGKKFWSRYTGLWPTKRRVFRPGAQLCLTTDIMRVNVRASIIAYIHDESAHHIPSR